MAGGFLVSTRIPELVYESNGNTAVVERGVRPLAFQNTVFWRAYDKLRSPFSFSPRYRPLCFSQVFAGVSDNAATSFSLHPTFFPAYNARIYIVVVKTAVAPAYTKLTLSALLMVLQGRTQPPRPIR